MKKHVKNQKGQGVMEYVILSSLIGIFCLAIIGQYGGTLKNKINNMKKSINQNLSNDKYHLDQN